MNVALTKERLLTYKVLAGLLVRLRVIFVIESRIYSVIFESYLKTFFDIFLRRLNLLAGAEAEERCTLCA